MPRHRLVCGLRDAGVRRNLLARSTLSLQESEEAAIAAEMAAHNVVQQMGDGPMSDGINASRKKQEWQKFAKRLQPGRITQSSDNQTCCLCCGSDSHKTTKCRFRRSECFCCRRRGTWLLCAHSTHAKKT
ncbi:hypothetical protein HPB50_006494 [Hyalomma asiaticum]|uniref:Uncharacterized protein n=1 Tax=Hyalomma asiaticum TaxID=266040 RepID=A0ACB7SH90_HYAAI|nr:hypothetical protein HPB50_006494 [Hyalomma asiaticum]